MPKSQATTADEVGDPPVALRRSPERTRLNGYEVPRDFLIETEPFSLENGLLSGVGKFLRPKLKDRYGARLEQLYATDGRRSGQRVAGAAGTAVPTSPVLATVVRAVQATLGVAAGRRQPEARFIDLGGDSLSALTFSRLLTDIFGVDVPVGVVIDPTADLLGDRQIHRTRTRCVGDAATDVRHGARRRNAPRSRAAT